MERFLRRHVCAALAAMSVVLATHPGRCAAACAGDCNGDGQVTVDELIIMVGITLGSAPLTSCVAGDADGNGSITVDDIVVAVNHSLGVCPPPTATPTPSPSPSPSPNTPVPTLGPLGTRHFVLNPEHSTFTAVLSASTSFPLGNFQGQKNGETGLLGYLDLRAGQPDNQGFATIDVVDASDYLYVDATAQAQVVFCIKPIVPVANAGLVTCKGGLDFSVGLTQNHHLGQIGVNGFSAEQCTNQGGNIESPNQICGTGAIGQVCRDSSDCGGVCGLSPSTCSMPSTTRGSACQADANCDTTAGADDGVCGQSAPHPGVCNGTFQVSQLGGNSGPGAVSISPVPQLGLQGLPVEISTELALPCGDEGPGMSAPIAFTSALFRSTILNFNNLTNVCGAGIVDSSCITNTDCDSAAGAGDGICGAIFQYDTHGENFSCADWTDSNAPGCLVFSAPQLDANPQTIGADLITAFTFCGR